MAGVLRLTGRYYRSIPITDPGYEQEALELALGETALVSLHCWNIGCPGGPPADPQFCVGMGYPETMAEEYRIMQEAIRPALDAARACALAVCHVQAEGIARRYPEWYKRETDAGPAQTRPDASGPPSGAQEEAAVPGRTRAAEAAQEAIPGYRQSILERSHGVKYAEKSGLATMDFPEVVAPLAGEPIVHQTAQFDRILRERGIVNLVYAGFATDMCILNAPGGMGPMFGLGYRVLLIREATLGVECPDTMQERIATRWGIRYLETHWGDTVGLDDFLAACDAAADRGEA